MTCGIVINLCWRKQPAGGDRRAPARCRELAAGSPLKSGCSHPQATLRRRNSHQRGGAALCRLRPARRRALALDRVRPPRGRRWARAVAARGRGCPPCVAGPRIASRPWPGWGSWASAACAGLRCALHHRTDSLLRAGPCRQARRSPQANAAAVGPCGACQRTAAPARQGRRAIGGVAGGQLITLAAKFKGRRELLELCELRPAAPPAAPPCAAGAATRPVCAADRWVPCG